MSNRTRNVEIPQGAFDLYDAYAHGLMSRRDFFAKLGRYSVGGMSVATLAACLMPDYENKLQTREGEADLIEAKFDYMSPKGAGPMQGYLVRPAGVEAPLGGVVVIHENRGLNPHIKDVARRVAKAGYVALAPDALFPLGGYPGDDDSGRALMQQRDRAEMVEDFMAAAEALKVDEVCTGAVACVGFCFGGAVANMMAVRQPWLAGAVPFYGGWPSTEDAANLRVPLLIHLAGLDARVNAGWPDYEAALKANGAAYEAYIYDDVNHGFHNDTTARYAPEAASLAWARTLDFFAKTLA